MIDGDTIQSLRLVNCYFNTAIEAKVLEELSAGHETELINIEELLKELQDKVVKNINNNDEFDSLVDKIEQLRNQKEELTREQAQDHRNAECVTELKEAIEIGKDEALAYSDKLVRDFIEKIEVFHNMLRVTLKAGSSTMGKLQEESEDCPSLQSLVIGESSDLQYN